MVYRLPVPRSAVARPITTSQAVTVGSQIATCGSILMVAFRPIGGDRLQPSVRASCIENSQQSCSCVSESYRFVSFLFAVSLICGLCEFEYVLYGEFNVWKFKSTCAEPSCTVGLAPGLTHARARALSSARGASASSGGRLSFSLRGSTPDQFGNDTRSALCLLRYGQLLPPATRMCAVFACRPAAHCLT